MLVHNCDTKLLGTARDNLLNSITNPKLKSIINELYRPGAKLGNGSSMDAFRIEGSHNQKLFDYDKGLQNVYRNRKKSPLNKNVKETMRDIQDVLTK